VHLTGFLEVFKVNLTRFLGVFQLHLVHLMVTDVFVLGMIDEFAGDFGCGVVIGGRLVVVGSPFKSLLMVEMVRHRAKEKDDIRVV